MNELQLSSDLNVIAIEINSYQRMAGEAIFEIGRRLKHVKENDLAHGEWEGWLSTIDMTRQHAHRFTKVYEEFGESNVTPMLHLGINALYQIATIPPEEREKEHITSKGETKTVDEMTTRELQEVKRKLKQTEQQVESERKERERLEQVNEELANVEPKVIKEEVIPDSVKKKIIERDKEILEANMKIGEMQSKLDMIKKQQKYENDEEKHEKELKALSYEANKSVLKTKLQIDEFLKEVAVTSYRRGAIASSSQGTKDKLQEGMDDLKNFIKEMEMALHGTIENIQ